MHERHEQNSHQSSNGFLTGAIIGAVVTLLFTTKKGREIVKDLADRGVEKLSEFEENVKKQKIMLEEDLEESDYIEPKTRPMQIQSGNNIEDLDKSVSEVEQKTISVKKPDTNKSVSKSVDSVTNKTHAKVTHQKNKPGKAVIRRFFKGPKKN